MPNNFKLTGNYYVSKTGNDANAGTSPDAPKRTIQGVISATSRKPGTVIIGAGVYSESLSATSDYNMTLLADGLVIIKAPNILSTINFTNNYNSQRNFYATDIVFENFDYIQFSTSGINASAIQFTNCTFKYSDLFFYWGAAYVYFSGCKFINSNLTINTKDPNGIGIRSIDKCIFINSFVDITDTAGNTFINSYVNSSAYISIPSTIINFNNIQCPIKNNLATTLTTGVYQDTYGRYYDLSITTSTGDGSIGNPYGRPLTANKLFSYSTSIILYPTTNPSGSSLDPKFNNILKQDFSLQSDSPHVGRASNYIDNIGGTYVATRLDASGSTFSGSNATVDSLTFVPFSDYVISGSAVTGSVTSAAIFVSSSAKVLQSINYNGLLAFNKDTGSLSGSNVNVPDVLTYTSASGQPGANPDRLTYYMRWTTGSSQPVTEAQWDNGGLWPTGSFNVFEWNAKPSVDYLGRGNGDQNFNAVNTPTYVKATWIQLKLTLRNDYLI